MLRCFVPSKLGERSRKLMPVHYSQFSIHPLRKSNFLSLSFFIFYLSYQLGNSVDTAAKQQVHMVFHQHPGIALRLAVGPQKRKPVQKFLSVLIGSENNPQFDSANHDVLEHPGCI
jgi:hypothetical protein